MRDRSPITVMFTFFIIDPLVFNHLREFFDKEFQKLIHFFGKALEVFRRKCIKCGVYDPKLLHPVENLHRDFSSGTVPECGIFSACLCKSPVSILNDGYMSRNVGSAAG